MFKKLVLLFCLTAASRARSQASADNIGVYLELLKFHATQPAMLASMKLTAFPSVSREVLERLSPEILKAHFSKHLNNYVAYKNRLAKAQTDFSRIQRQLEHLPLTNTEERPGLELGKLTQENLIKQIPLAIFRMSMNANVDLQQSLKTLPPEKRVASPRKVTKPKLPGTYGGSAEEREQLKAADKIFLTPVDKEFYQSQLGKKMERDFGGKAEFWSYDYEKDEMYVRVKGDVGRVRVIKDQGAARIIQTRSGADFVNVFKDEAVDLFKAKGRFLTGNKDDDSLFGEMPKNTGPQMIDERKLPPGHHVGDGHDHSH